VYFLNTNNWNEESQGKMIPMINKKEEEKKETTVSRVDKTMITITKYLLKKNEHDIA